MAQSFHPLSTESAVEDYEDVNIHHEPSDLTYRVVEENGRYFQEELRLDADGGVIHRLRREMKYVVGSGSAARTYLTEENGRYYELPLTWYTQESRWDFSPGYEHVNVRFDRLIPDRCMTCHNSYPQPAAFVEGKYYEVPDGIGCERCHGPGSIHVDSRLVSPEVSGTFDTTIVNPAHLSFDRRLDVCQQCHLHTTVSILREGRSAYDFRPSQRLSDYVALFAADEFSSVDDIDVISHADRMKRSGCFIETQATDDPMDCLTCHNPHEGFRDVGPEYFNRTCRSCHDLAERSELDGLLDSRAIHTEAANCSGCHMPKVRAEGTPHASFTDHWIRVVSEIPDEASSTSASASASGSGSGSDLGSSSGSASTSGSGSDLGSSSGSASASGSGSGSASGSGSSSVTLTPYFDEEEASDVYRGMAYVVYGRQRGDSSALRRGVRILERTLRDPESFGEAHFLLGFANRQLGQLQPAITALERSIAIDPDVPERLNALAQAYEAAGRNAAAIEELYRRALQIQPDLARVRVNLGRFLETQGRLSEAIDEYRQAIDEEPWLEEASYNLGTAYLRTGQLEPAEQALKDAVRLDPDYLDALGNLGLLLASTGREAEARRYFEQALRADPMHPTALGNLGAFHLNTGNLDDAIDLLERSVQADPQYVDGLVNLAIAYYQRGESALARRYAEEASRISPQNQRAQDILDAL